MKDKGTAPIGISEKESENDELLLRRSIYSAQRRSGGTREFMEPKSDALLKATHSRCGCYKNKDDAPQTRPGVNNNANKRSRSIKEIDECVEHCSR